MAESKLNAVQPKPTNNGSSLDAVDKPWFCAAVARPGELIKVSAETPAAFLPVLATASIAWVDYVARGTDFDTEAATAATQVGFTRELVSALTTAEWHSTYEDRDTELGFKLPSVQVRESNVELYQLIILVKKNFVLTVHPVNVDRRFGRLRRYSDSVIKKIPATAPDIDRLSLLASRIIDHNNDRNFEHLRQIEERGDKLNEIMTDPNTPRSRIGPEIYHLKHTLITYLDALWNTVDVLHTLRYGDAELITDDPGLLQKLSLLAEDVNRQIELAEHMSDVLASGLEVLQSIYNNQLQTLNNRLALVVAYLTIIGTAVLVPNTLATMLGNGVFTLGPQDLWWYVVLMVGSTAIATFLVYWWVRRRGWIPKREVE